MEQKSRCKWCNPKNSKYIKYHDKEWCKPNFNEKYFLHIQIASAEPANGSFFRMHDKKRDNQN